MLYNKQYNDRMKFVIGVGYYMVHLFFSFLNDSLTKYLIIKISGWQILFFRLLLGSCILLIVILVKDINYLKTQRIALHFLRGVIFFVAILLWSYGLKFSLLSQSTLIAFVIPIFVLVLASIFLKEKVTKSLWVATIIGFCGIIIAIRAYNSAFNIKFIYLIISAILFAIMDILNKKYIDKESLLSMLFYPAFFASIFTFFPAYKTWVAVNSKDLILLSILALGGNLVYYFLLKAFSLVNVSVLSPFRYLEIIIASIIGWVLFDEMINIYLIIASVLIIPSSSYIFYKKLHEHI